MWAKRKTSPTNLNKQNAFTIVELLIVIVVIGILAAITIVAYNGLQNRARQSALASDVRQAVAKLELIRSDTAAYPLNANDLPKSPDTTYDYTVLNNNYCLTATNTSHPTTGSYYATNSNKKAQPGPCPVGHWTFNGDATDSSVYENDGTIVGATLTTDRNGRVNSAYEFNGSNNYINFGTSSELNITGDISISSWIKPSSANNAAVVTWVNGSYSTFPFHHTIDTGYTRFNGGNAGNITSNSGVVLNEWQHVVITADGTELRFYIDGAPDSGNPFTLSTTSRNAGNGYLTASTSRSSQQLDGRLDDVRIYDRALSEAEVMQLYEATN